MMTRRPSPEAVVRDFMAAGKDAWPTGDASTLGRYFSEDAENRNGPQEPIRGREATVSELGYQMRMGGEVEAEIRHLVVNGPVVFVERVDYVRLAGKTAGMRIAGVFDVNEGVITAWRDYFDSGEFITQLSPD